MYNRSHEICLFYRYMPPTFIDYEDVNGTVHPGAWRRMVQNDTGMRDLGRVGPNNYTRMYILTHCL